MTVNMRELLELKRIIPRERLGDENDVQRRKWFDYRFLPAAAATRLFSDTYVEVYREKWATYMDRDSAQLKQPVPKAPGRREVNALWMARVVADELGVPYRFFIQASIDAAARRGCRHFPLPNQLYHTLALPVIVGKWRELRRARLQFSQEPIYLNENFQGLPEQIQHREWVIGEIKAMGSSGYQIEDAVNTLRILSEGDVRLAFGGERSFELQTASLSSNSASHVRGISIRSCLGLTGPTSGDATCNDCGHMRACSGVAGKLDEIIVSKFGCNDPHKARKTRQTRERVRRHRAKKRDAKSAAQAAAAA